MDVKGFITLGPDSGVTWARNKTSHLEGENNRKSRLWLNRRERERERERERSR
jgi:hypothetical protein